MIRFENVGLRYGLGAEDSSRYPERIGAVTGERVLAAAQRILSPQAEVIALVAPEAAVPEELKR